jgi:hypothetical protein
VLPRPVARLSLFGLAKLLFPTSSGLPPKRSVLRVDRVPLKLATFFDLLFEEFLPIERHGARPTKKRPPPREDGLTDLGSFTPHHPIPTVRRSNPQIKLCAGKGQSGPAVELL